MQMYKGIGHISENKSASLSYSPEDLKSHHFVCNMVYLETINIFKENKNHRNIEQNIVIHDVKPVYSFSSRLLANDNISITLGIRFIIEGSIKGKEFRDYKSDNFWYFKDIIVFHINNMEECSSIYHKYKMELDRICYSEESSFLNQYHCNKCKSWTLTKNNECFYCESFKQSFLNCENEKQIPEYEAFLLRNGFIKEYQIRGKDRYFLDFYNEKMNLAIEIDGNDHKNRWHADLIRTRDLYSRYGIYVIRYTKQEADSGIIEHDILKFKNSSLENLVYFPEITR